MDKYKKEVVMTKRYNKALKKLKKVFGYESFKPYQYQIIDNILSIKDVVAIMPTGYGKSLCFQLPPLLTNELSIVVSPLIALMTDQQMILNKIGIACCCYNSTLGIKKKREIEKELIEGKYKIMYITPEALIKSRYLIDKIYEHVGICMLAIDEAHCLSSYGFDFRPAYIEIINIRKILADVPVLAVTATATDKVTRDIINLMDMKNIELIKTSFDRPNLVINVKQYTSNTIDQIINIIKNTKGSSIVYCVTKADTEKLAEILNNNDIKAKPYHGGLTKNERIVSQEGFMNDEYECISATIAFGMGINKSNVRVVIHYGCPQNIDSYYQEIGRAGRDGKKSLCYLYYKQKDFIIQQRFINDIKDEKYRIVRKKLLHDMCQYVDTNGCRRGKILKYFGEDIKVDNCGNCDNCLTDNKNIKTIKKNDEYKLYKIINIIMTVQTEKKTSYGTTTIGLILKGSKSKKIKSWMHNLTYYGSMCNYKIKDITSFIQHIITLRYLENYNVGDCIYALRCTKKGLEFGKMYEIKLNDMVNSSMTNKMSFG